MLGPTSAFRQMDASQAKALLSPLTPPRIPADSFLTSSTTPSPDTASHPYSVTDCDTSQASQQQQQQQQQQVPFPRLSSQTDNGSNYPPTPSSPPLQQSRRHLHISPNSLATSTANSNNNNNNSIPYQHSPLHPHHSRNSEAGKLFSRTIAVTALPHFVKPRQHHQHHFIPPPVTTSISAPFGGIRSSGPLTAPATSLPQGPLTTSTHSSANSSANSNTADENNMHSSARDVVTSEQPQPHLAPADNSIPASSSSPAISENSSPSTIPSFSRSNMPPSQAVPATAAAGGTTSVIVTGDPSSNDTRVFTPTGKITTYAFVPKGRRARDGTVDPNSVVAYLRVHEVAEIPTGPRTAMLPNLRSIPAARSNATSPFEAHFPETSSIPPATVAANPTTTPPRDDSSNATTRAATTAAAGTPTRGGMASRRDKFEQRRRNAQPLTVPESAFSRTEIPLTAPANRSHFNVPSHNEINPKMQTSVSNGSTAMDMSDASSSSNHDGSHREVMVRRAGSTHRPKNVSVSRRQSTVRHGSSSSTATGSNFMMGSGNNNNNNNNSNNNTVGFAPYPLPSPVTSLTHNMHVVSLHSPRPYQTEHPAYSHYHSGQALASPHPPPPLPPHPQQQQRYLAVPAVPLAHQQQPSPTSSEGNESTVTEGTPGADPSAQAGQIGRRVSLPATEPISIDSVMQPSHPHLHAPIQPQQQPQQTWCPQVPMSATYEGSSNTSWHQQQQQPALPPPQTASIPARRIQLPLPIPSTGRQAPSALQNVQSSSAHGLGLLARAASTIDSGDAISSRQLSH